MELEDLIELRYKCKECDFITPSDEEIKKHISDSHQLMLAQKVELSDPTNLQKPRKTWMDIFNEGHGVTRSILGALDHETFLVCRLVCQGWRQAVNRYKPTWKEIKGTSFQRALQLAIERGHKHVTEMLISNAANVVLTDGSGDDKTLEPIHLAATAGKPSIVEMLIANGAKVDSKDEYGLTSLSYASVWGHLSVAEILVAHGADVNSRDGLNDETPLHRASEGTNASIVEFLLTSGANVNAKTGENETALHMASLSGNKSIVGILVSNGACLKARDICGCTPLHNAKNAEIVELLCKHGADINARNDANETLLQKAERLGSTYCECYSDQARYKEIAAKLRSYSATE